jgi:hypothetical protein
LGKNPKIRRPTEKYGNVDWGVIRKIDIPNNQLAYFFDEFQTRLERNGWTPEEDELRLSPNPQCSEDLDVKYYVKKPFQHLTIGIHSNPMKNEIAWVQRLTPHYGKILAAFMTLVIILTGLIRLMIPTRNEFALILFIIGTIISLGTILYLMYNFYSRLESDDVGTAFIETVMNIESKKIPLKPLKNTCVSMHSTI